MHYARTENNIVAQVLRVDPLTIFAPDAAAMFTPCPQDVEVGWLWDGTDYTAPAEAPIPIPQSVSPRQIRQALTRAGLRDGVEAAVAAGDQDTKDWYEFATVFERSNPHVVAMGTALGVSELQLDELFTLAATL